MTHWTTVGRVLTGAAVLALPLTGATPASAHSHEPTVHGCRSGDVCLYKYDNYRGVHGRNHPDAVFYSYGLHRIYGFTAEGGSTVDNQYGFYSPHARHQYYGAACYFRDSRGLDYYSDDRGFPAQSDPHFDLLPINSVRLVKETGTYNQQVIQQCHAR